MKTINIKNINPIDYITIDLSDFVLKKDKEIKEIIETVEEDSRNIKGLKSAFYERFLNELKQYLKRRQIRRRNLKAVKNVLGGESKGRLPQVDNNRGEIATAPKEPRNDREDESNDSRDESNDRKGEEK